MPAKNSCPLCAGSPIPSGNARLSAGSSSTWFKKKQPKPKNRNGWCKDPPKLGGLPDRMHSGLGEPLRELFKDEVREVGAAMGLPRELLWRQPFPGPGLAVRCLGEVTEERLRPLRRADAILEEEVRASGLYESLWQSFAVLLPVRSVGVQGDERTYDETIAIRAVHSR